MIASPIYLSMMPCLYAGAPGFRHHGQVAVDHVDQRGRGQPSLKLVEALHVAEQDRHVAALTRPDRSIPGGRSARRPMRGSRYLPK